MFRRRDSTDTSRKELEDLLSRKMKIASCKAIESDGVIDESEVRELRNLARLVKIRRLLSPPERRKRWPLIAMLFVTLGIVSLLFFVHVKKTEIELDVVSSEISFVLAKEEQALTNSMDLSSIGLSGVQQVDVPSLSSSELAKNLTSDEGEKSVRLTSIASGKQPGSLNLGRIILPSGTRIVFRRGDGKNDYRLSLELPENFKLVLRIDGAGTIRVSTSNAPSEELALASPQGFEFAFGEANVNLDLTLKEEARNPFASHISTKDPSFLRFEEIIDTERTLSKSLPTIISGSLYYQELNGQERQLRGNEGLQLTNGEGDLRSLEIATNGILFKFVGNVSGIETGLGAYKSNLMPTYLEFFKANHSLVLMWTATLYLFGLFYGVVRWWGGT